MLAAFAQQLTMIIRTIKAQWFVEQSLRFSFKIDLLLEPYASPDGPVNPRQKRTPQDVAWCVDWQRGKGQP
jgi:hypothetical protein